MNRPVGRFRANAAVMVAAVLLLAGCQGYRDGSTRTVGELTDDVAIQSRIKLALLNDEQIKGLAIDTHVHRGVVTLSGRAGSDALRQRAVAIASGVKGVVRVVDELTVAAD